MPLRHRNLARIPLSASVQKANARSTATRTAPAMPRASTARTPAIICAVISSLSKITTRCRLLHLFRHLVHSSRCHPCSYRRSAERTHSATGLRHLLHLLPRFLLHLLPVFLLTFASAFGSPVPVAVPVPRGEGAGGAGRRNNSSGKTCHRASSVKSRPSGTASSLPS